MEAEELKERINKKISPFSDDYLDLVKNLLENRG